MKLALNKVSLGLLVSIFLAAVAHAAADADVAAGNTVLNDSWTLVKASLVAIGLFFICYRLFRKATNKI